MPPYDIKAATITILQNASIIDTNVLVAAFNKKQDHHDDAKLVLDESGYQWLVPAAVVVETWGMLVGSLKDWKGGFDFLAWLATPGKAVVVLPQKGTFDDERELIAESHLDCVDAVIANLATEIRHLCKLDKPLIVATYDTRDFLRLLANRNLHFRLWDMRDGTIQDLD